MVVDACMFTYRDVSVGTSDIQQAINLYSPLMFPGLACASDASDVPPSSSPSSARAGAATVTSVEISVTDPVLANVSVGVPENYVLVIPNPATGAPTISLTAPTYIGVLRGESSTQHDVASL